MTLAVVTAYFNPCSYKQRLKNYLLFRDNLLMQQVPLLTVEQVLPGAEPEITPAGEMYLCVKGGAMLWQKERLLNLGIAALPPAYDAVAWLDGDVLFLDPRWHRKAEQLLSSTKVLQLFQLCANLLKDQDAYQGQGLMLPGHVARHQLGARWGRPGLAWAAQRSLLARHGLYDACIVGGGDVFFLQAVEGETGAALKPACTAAHFAHYRQWAAAVAAAVNGSVGFLPTVIAHLWHGDKERRGYQERKVVLQEGEYDPQTDIHIGPSGAWEWASAKPKMHQRVCDYFFSRDEDSSSLSAEPSEPRGLLSWADSAHFAAALRLIRSARASAPHLPICMLDVGLTAEELQALAAAGVSCRKFEWKLYEVYLARGKLRALALFLPVMLALSPFRQTMWVGPESVVLRDVDALFAALQEGPILYTELEGAAQAQNKCIALNSCVIALDWQRDAALLERWTQWAWNLVVFPGLHNYLEQAASVAGAQSAPSPAASAPAAAEWAAWEAADPESPDALDALRRSQPGAAVVQRGGAQCIVSPPLSPQKRG